MRPPRPEPTPRARAPPPRPAGPASPRGAGWGRSPLLSHTRPAAPPSWCEPPARCMPGTARARPLAPATGGSQPAGILHLAQGRATTAVSGGQKEELGNSVPRQPSGEIWKGRDNQNTFSFGF